MKALFIALAFCLPVSASADSPESPFTWLTTSHRGDFVFKMIASEERYEGGKRIIDREGLGIAYSFDSDGDFTEIWRTQGWWSPKGYLSDDGRYFVRMGPWAEDSLKQTDLAVAFYDRGKLVKQYQVRELLKKPDLIEETSSHYRWIPEKQTKPTGMETGAFHLVMIDKTSYYFELATGNIIETGIDTGAFSWREIWNQEKEVAREKGRKLYDSSAFKSEYDSRFELTNIEASGGKFMSIWFKGPEWHAELKSKQTHDHPAQVDAVFPINPEGLVEAFITPDDIDQSIALVLKHPYSVDRFNNHSATGIRFRITGDRLHWNTPELQEFLKIATGKEAPPEELRSWGYFIIDEPGHVYTSFYFNKDTREVLYKTSVEKDDLPVLLNAGGNPISKKSK